MSVILLLYLWKSITHFYIVGLVVDMGPNYCFISHGGKRLEGEILTTEAFDREKQIRHVTIRT